MMVDVLDRLREDLESLDREIESIDVDLLNYCDDDIWDRDEIRSLRTLKSRYRRDKVSLLKQYHSINQDLTYRNREIESRIKKMESEILMMDSVRDAINDGKRILNYVDHMALELYNKYGAEEEGDDGGEGSRDE